MPPACKDFFLRVLVFNLCVLFSTPMKLPSDREIHRTAIAEFWFDDDGVLFCNATPAERTIENLTESFNLVEKITEGKKVCLVADLTITGVQAKKERDFATAMLPRYYKAIA